MPSKFNRKLLYTRFPRKRNVKTLELWYTALQLWHFNAFVTDLANSDDLFRPVATRECVILVLLG